ncbi:unnamed protein product [Oppiella nova]|uniref:Nuclear receptor domain-containing protein n=1 Tax=Oppiella nova TaxID=334625 RepID=A0A7R9QG70_9ACAR|nr:unnamed protein product [Oppiella nova]CAG2164740.1 unnamed protein product [Oppiella nova]
MKEKVDKICEICSDKGIGRHFGAITCESCKAFFRRNANKDKLLECPSDGKCKINANTRKLCQKCRLNKCLAMGMKKEFILTDKEREERRQLVEDNRRKRKQLTECQKSSQESDLPSNSLSNKSSNPPSNESTISWYSDSDFLGDITACVLDVSDEDLSAQIMEIEDYVNNEDSDQSIETLSDRLMLQDINERSQQIAVIPLFKELTDYNGLNELEANKIGELLGASKLFDYPTSKNIIKLTDKFNFDEYLRSYSQRTEESVKEALNYSKMLSAFTSEFIRSHEEREERRQLVEENRRKRKQLNISQNSYPESNESSNPSSMVSTISSDCGVSDSFFNDIIGCVLDVNERELREQIMEIENYVNNEDLDPNIETLSARQLLEDINQKSRQMAVIPMFKELTDYNGLNELETNKMTELLGASKIFERK